MFFRALITDGGAHPAEKWAVATAEMIFPIGPELEKAQGDRLLKAKRLQLDVADALTGHHAGVQNHEKTKLAALGDDRLDHVPDHAAATAEAVEAVMACMKGTPWEDKTANPEWREEITRIIAMHFGDNANIEREWHCHRNPSDRASAFLSSKPGA